MSAKASPAQLKARLERRKSGAAGTHGDRRTKRNRTRAAQKSRALRDWE